MKFPWTVVTAMVTSSFYAAIPTHANTPSSPEVEAYHWKSPSAEELQSRIADITLPFESQYNTDIRDLIKEYVTAGYKDTEVMLGRSVLFFPIFEHYLSSYQLPVELKYLPIIESGLKAAAESPVGAAGLWQFMPVTARQYGLVVNSEVDERKDPYKSTEAAMKMLGELFDQFKDWALVLAAYNCGPTRVQKAINAAGGKYDFWAIQAFLPAQTQKYVPTFIAAAYVANYYGNHSLQPRFPSSDLDNMRVMMVYQRVTFRDIATQTGISQYQISLLNPSYLQGVIPVSSTGSFLILPAEEAKKFSSHLSFKVGIKNAQNLTAPLNTFESSHVVKAGERIEDLASAFHCSVQDIMRWNNLTIPDIYVHQELTVFLPKSMLSKRA